MKKWKIEIVATDEKQAVKVLKTITESFNLAVVNDLPMEHIFIETGNREMSVCELVKE